VIRNVHTRIVPLPPDVVGAQLERILEPGLIWPSGWPQLLLDNGLELGSDGGHGPIRYRVVDHRPGRRIEFRFTPGVGLDGTHALEVYDGPRPGSTLARHTLIGAPRGGARLLWPLAIRWMHDQLIEELLANLARAAGDETARPPRRSPWVRLTRKAAPLLVPAPGKP
jgi:hypothetical protein